MRQNKGRQVRLVSALLGLGCLVLPGCGENGLRLGWALAEKPAQGAGGATPIAAASPPTGREPASAGNGRRDTGTDEPTSTPNPDPSSDSQLPRRRIPVPSPDSDRAPSPQPRPVPAPGSAPAPLPEAHQAFLSQVLAITNAFRVERKLPSLKLNAELSKAAQEFAERMAREDFFDHNSPDGDGPGDRILACGYRWLTHGENIARGYRNAYDAMDAWINSPAHLANLAHPGFTEIGLGYAEGPSVHYGPRTPYWVQEFASPPARVEPR